MSQEDEQVSLKILMHSAKYPTQAINGILLGNDSGIVLDSIPLAHNNLSLTPLIEIGLSIIENYTKEKKLNIVGYYFANEREKDTTTSEIHLTIFKKIQKNFSNASLWRVRIKKKKKYQLNYSQIDNETWPTIKIEKGKDFKFNISKEKILKNYLNIIDFEEHLNDISKDFLNQKF